MGRCLFLGFGELMRNSTLLINALCTKQIAREVKQARSLASGTIIIYGSQMILSYQTFSLHFGFGVV